MNQTCIENEKYLIKEYAGRKGLTVRDITAVGRHPLTEYLCVGGVTLCSSLANVHGLTGELWYVLDPKDYEPGELKKAEELCEKANVPFLCIILIQNIKPHPVIRRYSEMELLTVMGSELSEVRHILSGCSNAKAVILDRLGGAGFDSPFAGGVLREAEDRGTITVTQDMAERFRSCLYLPDAVSAVLTVSLHGKPGNIYNATSFYMSEFDLRSRIYSMLAPHGVTLNVVDGFRDKDYAALSDGKLRSLGWEPVCSLDDALRYTLPAYGNKFDIQSDYICGSYSGKLSALRSIQLEMLRDIDRICRRHDIRYFLSGGSMLGAVRHGGYIPWDDDIDIAMLREDFERFKEIAPRELSGGYSYLSFRSRNGYHYFFDRVTAKDTYFASRYSDSYDMPKGISIDIFVYDRVPDGKSAQRRHWQRLMRKRLLMNVRWKDEPRGEGKSRLISKLLLPFLRLRPMDRYSDSYDKATRRYEKSSSNTVMPPATDHDWHECMPREWFTEVVPWKFEDVDTFLPKGYDGFLKIWYGEDYMTMLPLCRQEPYHDYYRLDLGPHIVEGSQEHFDFKGELL